VQGEEMLERKSQRLPFHNYSDPKKYYITIKINSRELPLGEIINGKILLNEIGRVVETCWEEIPEHYKACEIGEYIIMPDHIHGIIRINKVRGVGDRHACPENYMNRNFQIIPQAIGGFKSAVSRIIHRKGYQNFKWQRSYYDRIIRVREFNSKIKYIQNNPQREYEKNLKIR